MILRESRRFDHWLPVSRNLTLSHYEATDLGDFSSGTGLVTIIVIGVNDTPTDINLSNSTVAENSAIGTLIGNLSTLDPDVGDIGHIYTLLTAGVPFLINGDRLEVSGALDFETTNSYNITIRTTDLGGLLHDKSFTITITNVNDLPTITDIVDQGTNEDTATAAIPFTVGDVETAVGSLTVTATSSDQAVVPNANIVIGGAGAGRTITLTPVANQYGPTTITVTVQDGDGGTASDTFVLSVNSVNDLPTITDIVDLGTNEDTATAAIPFTVGDVETAVGSLTVTATSSDQAVVPNANIVIGGAGAGRTITLTPVANQFGTTTITVTVQDGDGGTASDTFVLSVNSVNDLPTISDIVDQGTNEDTATAAIPFTVGDVETAVGSLTVTATSSDQAVVPNANIVIGGAGAARTITLTPVANQFGPTTITVTVQDGDGGTASDTFVLSVNSVNDLPTISDIVDLGTNEDTATAAIPFTVGDVETAVGSLTVTATSSDQAVVPNANIVIGGAGAARTITLTPVANQFGPTTITVTVQDGDGGTASDTFVLSVNSVNDLPTIYRYRGPGDQ